MHGCWYVLPWYVLPRGRQVVQIHPLLRPVVSFHFNRMTDVS